MFNVGDKVQFICGGPIMVVSNIDYPDIIECQWFDSKNKVHVKEFITDTLKTPGNL